MSDVVRRVLAELRPGLERIYGPRLRGLFVFGSRARGDEEPDSDLDVLVVLDRVDGYAAEVERTGELVSTLSLRHRVSVSRVFAAEGDWLRGRTRFLAGLSGEAVPAVDLAAVRRRISRTGVTPAEVRSAVRQSRVG